KAANRYVRRTLRRDVSEDRLGGVKGSFPVDGSYGRFEYLAWAPKFLIDSLRLEQQMEQVARLAPTPVQERVVLRVG
ncbi:MAG: hypothetical protein KC645_01000, partial [Gemmatimonadetes bacterium]|nr:hypothetical protein [Gemmatimonadota bacterium]